MGCDIGSHQVRQLHGRMNIPAKSNAKQDSCRTSIPGAHWMGRSPGCNWSAQIKFSAADQDNGSLRPSGDNDCLSGKMCKERFHPAPDPIKSSVSGAIDPQQIQKRE
jgi:hypothetical protein